MVCTECGKEYDDSMNFCPYCGTENRGKTKETESEKTKEKTEEKTEESSENSVLKKNNSEEEKPETGEQEKNSDSTDPSDMQHPVMLVSSETPSPSPKGKITPLMKKLIIGSAAAATVIVALLAYNRLRPINLNMTDYVSASFSGYDGIGTADVDFDEEKFTKDLEKGLVRTGQIKKSDDLFTDDKIQLAFGMLSDTMDADVDVDKQTNLSNGEKVTCTIDMGSAEELKKYKIHLKGGKKSFKVSGLKKVEEFDPFKGVDVDFSGVNGFGTVTVKGDDDDLTYTADPESDLSNGDTVTVTVRPGSYGDFNDYANAHGKTPKATTKKYKVSGLKEEKDFDAFSDDMIRVSFVGTSGDGRVQVDLLKAKDYDLQYTADNAYSLSNGDKVKVTVSSYYDFDNDYIAQHGGKPKELTKTYTVEGLQEYVTKFSQISEDELAKLQKAGETVSQQEDAQQANYQINSLTYLGYYLMTPKEGQYADWYNQLFLVYKENATDTSDYHGSIDYHPGQAYDGIVAIRYYDLLVDKVGRITCDLSEITLAPRYSFPFTADRAIIAYDNPQIFYNEEISPLLTQYSAETNIQL